MVKQKEVRDMKVKLYLEIHIYDHEIDGMENTPRL